MKRMSRAINRNLVEPLSLDINAATINSMTSEQYDHLRGLKAQCFPQLVAWLWPNVYAAHEDAFSHLGERFQRGHDSMTVR